MVTFNICPKCEAVDTNSLFGLLAHINRFLKTEKTRLMKMEDYEESHAFKAQCKRTITKWEAWKTGLEALMEAADYQGKFKK